ncbi:hypothetical protein GCM10022381_26340 [Leifsonia kafniensis]|uniref:HTH cro/C1-type domain-containing protein n=1 Tax=Leifsonia kafniensis TaxID=475957 RepID=A0ABP7KMK9_9MICO
MAERSGVSRRTIINLEAGEANISLSGLDRLATALDTTFVSLVAAPSATPTAIDAVAWRGRTAESIATLLGSAPASREAQLWSWSLAAGDRYDAEPDADGWHEMILVISGQLLIQFENNELVLNPGDHSTYSSAQPYAYANPGKSTTRFARAVIS